MPFIATLRRCLDELVQDVRYALRSLRRNRAFTLVALLTLTLGIGANTLVFSIVSGILIRPLPYGEPDRLVQVNQTAPGFGLMALRRIGDYRAATTTLESMAGYVPSARVLQTAAGTERIGTVSAERGIFRVLGVEAAFGRTFQDDDPLDVIVVSAALARRQFGSAQAAVGQTLDLENQRFAIIGVMPDRFQFPYYTSRFAGAIPSPRVEIWGVLEPPRNPRSGMDFTVARLRDGVSRTAAREELNAIARRLASEDPESQSGLGVELTPLTDTIVGAVRPQLVVLAGAVGLVLLATCANVANLLLVRASTRSREIAVRAAIGAGRLRLFRQLLTESTVLALLGSALGLVLVTWGMPVIFSLPSAQVPRVADIGVDWRVFVFIVIVSLVTGMVFGLAPALAATRTTLQHALKGTAAGAGSPRGLDRLRDGLAVAEVSLAFVLVISAGLLTRELLRLRDTDIGLATGNVLTMHLVPNVTARDCAVLVDEIERLPGVRRAAFAQMLPLQSWGWTATFSIVGRPPFPPAERPVVELRYVTPGYFDALGIPIRRGRSFTDTDTATAPRVIIVNETLARRYFADTDPVGKETDRGTIVGVAGDVRQAGIDRPVLPDIYYPMAQNVSQVRDLGMSLIASTLVPPQTLVGPVRESIRRSYPSLAIFGVRTMQEIVSDSLARTTFYAWLVGSFALLALVVASAGIYGVMSYVVASRTREFGIRLALGADGRVINRLVLRQALVIVGIGLVIGLLGMAAATQFLERLIVGAGAVRPATIATSAGLLATVAILAALLPARRAGRVDPVTALRQEIGRNRRVSRSLEASNVRPAKAGPSFV